MTRLRFALGTVLAAAVVTIASAESETTTNAAAGAADSSSPVVVDAASPPTALPIEGESSPFGNESFLKAPITPSSSRVLVSSGNLKIDHVPGQDYVRVTGAGFKVIGQADGGTSGGLLMRPGKAGAWILESSRRIYVNADENKTVKIEVGQDNGSHTSIVIEQDGSVSLSTSNNLTNKRTTGPAVEANARAVYPAPQN